MNIYKPYDSGDKTPLRTATVLPYVYVWNMVRQLYTSMSLDTQEKAYIATQEIILGYMVEDMLAFNPISIAINVVICWKEYNKG